MTDLTYGTITFLFNDIEGWSASEYLQQLNTKALK